MSISRFSLKASIFISSVSSGSLSFFTCLSTLSLTLILFSLLCIRICNKLKYETEERVMKIILDHSLLTNSTSGAKALCSDVKSSLSGDTAIGGGA